MITICHALLTFPCWLQGQPHGKGSYEHLATPTPSFGSLKSMGYTDPPRFETIVQARARTRAERFGLQLKKLMDDLDRQPEMHSSVRRQEEAGQVNAQT